VETRLGTSVVPGHPFCNFFAFDLDGDGVDEIWFVNNLDEVHPFNLYEFCLERVDPFTGNTTGQWPWPHKDTNQPLSHLFRNHIFGGYVHEKPVLITAQGTYGPTFFQAWMPDMTHSAGNCPLNPVLTGQQVVTYFLYLI
jgi:hypothetical protein